MSGEPWKPSPVDTPYLRLGGEAGVRAIVARFYDLMNEREPLLARLHQHDERGHVSEGTRERFGLFFIGWLGGPQDYMARHGHPRLRMRHARVPVDAAMRDAWLRCMRTALEEAKPEAKVLTYLGARLGEVADFLRNVDEPAR